ncbi:SusC/RagA family TonB-linked outer membrane protein [Labilibaculum euxinus]
MFFYVDKNFRAKILYAVLLVLVGYVAKGQTISVNEQNTPLKHVLRKLEKQTEYSFFYNSKLVDDKVLISVEIESDTIQIILDAVLENTFISYKIIKKNIVLFIDDEDKIKNNTNSDGFKNMFSSSHGGEKTITGTIFDSDGLPLPGVNISIQGTLFGTQTNSKGKYAIEVANGYILEFSYIGFLKVVRKITPSSFVIDLKMRSDYTIIDEVIIVAYDKLSRSVYTGSAVNLNVKKVGNTPLASFQEAMQGNVAGLQMITRSGQPGATPDIRIRGIGSMNAGAEPLYVIDGIPVVSGNISQIAISSNIIAGINPKDIASITMLKDASATSIYGSRGANGVVLITTKKGKPGATHFDFSAQFGVSQILPSRNKPLNTSELSELLIESKVNSGDMQEEAETYIYDRIDKNINTDWVDVISRIGEYSQYNVIASGGNNKTNFYTSLGIFNQKGIIIGIDYKKLNAKVNFTHQVKNKLKIDLGLSVNHQKLHTNDEASNANNPVRAMWRTVPWEPVYNEDGSYNTNILLTYNPVGLVNENIRETKLYGIRGNLGLNYSITKNLNFETKGNFDFNLADEFEYDNPYFGAGRNDGGYGQAYDNKILNYNITNLLKYRWKVDSDNSLNFILGQEAQKIEASSVYAYASNYGALGLTTLENASVCEDASSSKTSSSLASYFFSINYSLKKRCIFNVTGRCDGSSRFGSEVRFANFGSIGLAWNICSENFMQQIKFVNSLKIRTSYGMNGNQEIDNFASRGLYETGADYDGEPGYVYSQQSNPQLTWEKNRILNIGVDFNLFKKVSGTIEYYTRTTKDLLFKVPISSTNGLTSYLDNFGEMKNNGWEISLNSININNRGGFSWTTNLNFTSNINKITKLENNAPIVSSRYIREVGNDFYTFYIPGYAGVDSENGDALWYTDATKSETTNRYSEAKPFKQGSALPIFYSGLTNSLSYKNFSLSFMLYLSYGSKVYDYWGRYVNSDGRSKLNDRGNMTRYVYENRWQHPGDITDVPKMVWGNTQSGLSSQHSTRFLYDGSYLRLRDLTFAYSFPDQWIKKLKIENLQLYFKTTNLLTWVKDEDIAIDPEVGINGQSNLRIPISKQFLVGLDLSF